MHQYDVSDRFHPRQTASVRLGGIVSRPGEPAPSDVRGCDPPLCR
ncbi:selenium-binding family protein [Streptomyces sp. NBC_01549]|nr:selenium-binding family protein [Streptomyces sp. NBC_01549]